MFPASFSAFISLVSCVLSFAASRSCNALICSLSLLRSALNKSTLFWSSLNGLSPSLFQEEVLLVNWSSTYSSPYLLFILLYKFWYSLYLSSYCFRQAAFSSACFSLHSLLHLFMLGSIKASSSPLIALTVSFTKLPSPKVVSAKVVSQKSSQKSSLDCAIYFSPLFKTNIVLSLILIE